MPSDIPRLQTLSLELVQQEHVLHALSEVFILNPQQSNYFK